MTSQQGGIVLGATGIALMCAMDAVAKALGAELTAFQVVFVRYLGAALWLAVWIALTRSGWPRLTDLGRQALRGLMLVVTATSFFYAVARLPLAMVAALGMTAPVYVTLIGAIVFRERVGPGPWLALALGAAGSAVIIVSGGSMDLGGTSGEPLAWGAAMLAPLAYAATLALLKHHSGHEEPAAMTLGQSVVAALFVLPLAVGNLPAVTAPLAGLATLIGFLGAVGFLLLVNGLRRMPVSVFAVIDYTGLVWAGIFGFAFFGEIPGLPLWLGGALIIAACLITARSKSPAKAAIVH